MKENFEILEAKFNSFLNRTIIGASKNYYRKQKNYELKELQIIDDEDYAEYLKDYVKKDDDIPFGVFGDNIVLNTAYESLSGIERTVIFLCFHDAYKTNEIAKILNMREQSISRIKKRALEQLKIYIERFDDNE